MNRLFSVALCFALAFVLEGCHHGIHSGTGERSPASSTTPAGISSSADVVGYERGRFDSSGRQC